MRNLYHLCAGWLLCEGAFKLYALAHRLEAADWWRLAGVIERFADARYVSGCLHYHALPPQTVKDG